MSDVRTAREWREMGYPIPDFVSDAERLSEVEYDEASGYVGWKRAWSDEAGEQVVSGLLPANQAPLTRVLGISHATSLAIAMMCDDDRELLPRPSPPDIVVPQLVKDAPRNRAERRRRAAEQRRRRR